MFSTLVTSPCTEAISFFTPSDDLLDGVFPCPVIEDKGGAVITFGRFHLVSTIEGVHGPG